MLMCKKINTMNKTKLILLLKSCGIGFIEGLYRSEEDFEDIFKFNNSEDVSNAVEEMNLRLSVNNKPLGEYRVAIGSCTESKVTCTLLIEAGKNFFPSKGFADEIFITLFPFDGQGTAGKFQAQGPFGIPKKTTSVD